MQCAITTTQIGEDDSLTNHEGKEHGLPKTPYPVTNEKDLQHTLFSKH